MGRLDVIDKDSLQGVLRTWRNHVLPDADSCLQRLFVSAHEVLFEYARKAESNAIQTAFIAGRRELDFRQTAVRKAFQDSLRKKLFECLDPSQRPNAPGSETLSLVSKDSFERSLALKTISEQALERHRELYYALSLRLGVIAGRNAVEHETLPAGPHQLAGIFEQAAQSLQVERQVLLALYTLFEHEVIRATPAWHEDLNEALCKLGVLPNITYRVKTDPGSLAAEGDSEPVPRSEGATKPDSRGHPASKWVDNHRSASHAPSSRDRSFHPGDVTHPVTRPDTASDAGSAPRTPPGESDPTTAPPAGSNPQLGEQMLGRIRELLSVRRTRQGQSANGEVRPDPANPAPASAVSAAIEHPAVRRAARLPETEILKEGIDKVTISRALLLRINMTLRAQREKIKEVVGDDRLSYFDEDTIEVVGLLFEEMLDEPHLGNVAKALLSRLHTPFLKLAIRDPSLLTRPDHPARHLFDNVIYAASRWVDESDLTQGIYPRLQRVVTLIVTTQELSTDLLQELDEGLSAEIELRAERQKKREARTVESEQGREKLEQAKAAAAKAAELLTAAKETPKTLSDFLSGPWADYLTLVYLRSNGELNAAPWRDAVELGCNLRNLIVRHIQGETVDDAEVSDLRRAIAHRLGDAVPHLQAQVEKVFSLFDSDQEVVLAAPESTPTAPQPAAPVDQVPLGDSAKNLLERLPTLPPGTWVVFKNHGDSGQTLKLSWYNDRTERFLFVDQAGAKALVVPLRKLAAQIDSEQAHVLLSTGTSYVESSLQRALERLKKQA